MRQLVADEVVILQVCHLGDDVTATSAHDPFLPTHGLPQDHRTSQLGGKPQVLPPSEKRKPGNRMLRSQVIGLEGQKEDPESRVGALVKRQV